MPFSIVYRLSSISRTLSCSDSFTPPHHTLTWHCLSSIVYQPNASWSYSFTPPHHTLTWHSLLSIVYRLSVERFPGKTALLHHTTRCHGIAYRLSSISLKPQRDAGSVMREAWCVFTEIMENRKSDSTCTSYVMRDAYSFWARVFTALGAVNTHHAALPWRHFMDSPGYPSRSLHVIQGQPRADPFVDYIVFFSYLCCFYGDWYIVMWLMIGIWSTI